VPGEVESAELLLHSSCKCDSYVNAIGRHEAFYTRMMARVMDEDPEGGLFTMRGMLRRVIAMPGKLMFDGKGPDLFDHFAATTRRSPTTC
jgi:hypothetical protein